MESGLPRRVGRYALFDAMASGGTATVHVGRLFGPAGFARTVCVKRLHPHLAQEAEFVKMLLDEARIASRIRHANVISILDVVSDDEVFVVMEYVPGVPLSRLTRLAAERGERIPLPIAIAIVRDLLRGLHAAHETSDERGEPLGVVHRDVSPQNVLVGADGVARVLDFGIAKARGRLSTTEKGQLKGKLAYMAPEQLFADEVSARVDTYAAGIVLWELLTGKRLFAGENEGHVLEQALLADVSVPSAQAPDIPIALDDVVMRALDREPSRRYATASEMVAALDACAAAASSSEVSAWVTQIAGDELTHRARRIREIEESSFGREAPRAAAAGLGRWRTGATVGVAVLVGTAIGAVSMSRARPSSHDTPVVAVVSAAPVTPPPPYETGETTSEVSFPAPSTEANLIRRVPAPAKVRAARPVVLKSSSSRPDPCNPPFTRDAEGVKVWKPDCVLR